MRSKLPQAPKDSGVPPSQDQTDATQSRMEMDFVAEQLANSARFRTMTIIDVFSKEALAIEVGQRLGGEHVVAALNCLAAPRKAPQYLAGDNGSEFAGRLLDLWAYHHQTQIDFSRPKKLTENEHVESFNGSFRDECLNLHWFESLEEAKAIIEA